MNLIRKMWIGVGILILLVCVLFGLFMFGISVEGMKFIGLSVVFVICFVSLSFFIISAAANKVSDGIVLCEPVIENRISKKELFREAEKINGMNTPWMVDVYEQEGWIDVTWRWKDSIDYELSCGRDPLNRNREVFYKFFKVYDDYTYDDVDMVTTINYSAGAYSLSVGAAMYVGKIRIKAAVFALGTNKDNGTGFHEYSVDSDELANFMHRWFSEHGYRYRGFSKGR